MSARVAIVSLGLLAAFLFNGCCTGVAGTIKVDKRMDTDLKDEGYESMGVRFRTSNPDWGSGLEQFRQLTFPKISSAGLVPKVVDLGPSGKATTELVLEIDVVDFRSVSAAARFWFGIFMGQAKIIASCVLKDEQEGTVLAQGAIGAYSAPSGCTNQIITHASTQVVPFLRGAGDQVK